jgi:fibronectin type 3 domain-containing protein
MNGRIYSYRLAAGTVGRFGPRTEEIVAVPGLFTIRINEDRPVTKERAVLVDFTAQNALAIRLGEQSDDLSGAWHSTAASVPWVLSAEDGLKTLYAQFRFADGSTSRLIADGIRLDTRAAIESMTFTGPSVRRPGDLIHFRLVAGEADGSASVTVAGFFDAVPLYDDGTSGDAAASDGIYERDLLIPATASAREQEVSGSFTDEAGNPATPLAAPVLLTVESPPEPVVLLEPVVSDPPDAPAVSLRWTLFRDDDFSAYVVYRAETADVDSTDRLIQTVRDRNSLELNDTTTIEGHTYYFRVYVENRSGLSSASNAVQAVVGNVRPPTEVNLEKATSSSPTRVDLEWTRCPDRDFHYYRLYRNDSGSVTEEDTLLAEIMDPSRTFWIDSGLVENTTYYYRVFVVDQNALSTRSNEAAAKTGNEPPPPVTLEEASAVDTTAATLTWSQSSVHDFAYYRLYRDSIPTVTPASSLLVEIDDPKSTSFRDHSLQPASTYHYRVFVYDDATEAEHAGSNTIRCVTPD